MKPPTRRNVGKPCPAPCTSRSQFQPASVPVTTAATREKSALYGIIKRDPHIHIPSLAAFVRVLFVAENPRHLVRCPPPPHPPPRRPVLYFIIITIPHRRHPLFLRLHPPDVQGPYSTISRFVQTTGRPLRRPCPKTHRGPLSTSASDTCNHTHALVHAYASVDSHIPPQTFSPRRVFHSSPSSPILCSLLLLLLEQFLRQWLPYHSYPPPSVHQIPTSLPLGPRRPLPPQVGPHSPPFPPSACPSPRQGEYQISTQCLPSTSRPLRRP